MTHELHCSTCDAIVSPGATKCPGCGLQLIASAQPAVYVEGPRFPLWGIALVAVVIFVILANIESRRDEAKAADAKAAFLADLQSGALNTPDAFEARCGMPRWTRETKKGTELHYLAGSLDVFVTLAPSGPVFETENVYSESGRFKSYRVGQSAESGSHYLGCK